MTVELTAELTDFLTGVKKRFIAVNAPMGSELTLEQLCDLLWRPDGEV